MQNIAGFIKDLVASPLNRIAPDLDEPAFDAPLIGVSRGDDPVWKRIKGHIGEVFWLPLEAFSLAFPQSSASASDLRIISWILPQTKATREAHRKEKSLPCKRWSQVRHYGEQFNEHLRRELVAHLTAQGEQAVAPVLLPDFGYRESPLCGICSNWSERHAAFVAGLGTFGLSDGLITAVGKSVRVGSVITTAKPDPTPRPYGDDHRAYCLFFRTGGRCKACMRRCPAKAISAQGHDKAACKIYIRGVTSPFVKNSQLGFAANSCGLCQAAVPCESGIPKLKSDEPAKS